MRSYAVCLSAPREAARRPRHVAAPARPRPTPHHRPRASQVLADGNETVRERACYALEAFCDELGDKIVGYLPHLMPRLVELVAHEGGKQHIRERCASAIASVAMAASAQFQVTSIKSQC